MNIILQIVLAILVILIVSGILGYLIAKLLFWRFIKKLDKKLKDEKELLRVKKLTLEQENSTIRKEENENVRRERIRAEESEILRRREQGLKDTDSQLSSNGRNEKRANVQDSDINETRKSNPRTEESDRPIDEDWADFG